LRLILDRIIHDIKTTNVQPYCILKHLQATTADCLKIKGKTTTYITVEFQIVSVNSK